MKTKTVYQADADGFFLYTTEACELPLQPGCFNVPYLACEDEPPAVSGGRVAKRVDSAWSVVDDNRDASLYVVSTGAPYQIGSEVEVDGAAARYDGGGPFPSWLTDAVPAPDAAVDSAPADKTASA